MELALSLPIDLAATRSSVPHLPTAAVPVVGIEADWVTSHAQTCSREFSSSWCVTSIAASTSAFAGWWTRLCTPRDRVASTQGLGWQALSRSGS